MTKMSLNSLQGLRGLLCALALIIPAVAVPATVTLTDAVLAAGTSASDVSAMGKLLEEVPRLPRRLIVELDEPALALRDASQSVVRTRKLDLVQQDSKAYINALRTRQDEMLTTLRHAVPSVRAATYRNEANQLKEHRYQIVLNGFAVELPSDTSVRDAIAIIQRIPGVKAVSPVRTYTLSMYASLPLIGAPSVWNTPVTGGRERAGAGIRVASMDTGVHKDAPMFSPAGFQYPYGFPSGGLGLSANNNGKIIASRIYVRPDDPPVADDDTPWPGAAGDSHGVHTAGTAAGNVVQAEYLGVTQELSGVAPGAWVMSYKVFNRTVSGNMTFDTPEGIAALEDIVRDGADVVNCSWGDGPSSSGGEYDPLDTALRNAWHAGVFVSLSAGNSGPNKATLDHPSADYIVVAATSSGGSFSPGSLTVTTPAPVPDTLNGMKIDIGLFGAMPAVGSSVTYLLKSARSIDPDNIDGCTHWEGTPFSGTAALISRGNCDFSQKVINAQSAGAEFVVIYNHIDDRVQTMSCGFGSCEEITIASIFIGKTDGERLVEWSDQHAGEARFSVLYTAYQKGNRPDEVIDFSSRGPGVGNTLKPDIAAPGVDILSQGYAAGIQGEAKHFGYGQVSGTSMAAPHIAGAAALLKQRYPLWSPADVKAALMSTAEFMDIYNSDGSPAQPLDIGAGRVNLVRALAPGVLPDPPSLGFGVIEKEQSLSKVMTLRNVTNAELVYQIRGVDTSVGFDQIKPLAGFSVSPSTVQLAPYQSVQITVTFDSAAREGVGDAQGYFLLEGLGPTASFPVWARVATPTAELTDVLVVDVDGSSFDPALTDYRAIYTQALGALGLTTTTIDVEPAAVALDAAIPEAAQLNGYRALVLFSGDNRQPALTGVDLDRLVEYAHGGGLILLMGNNLLSAVMDPQAYFYTQFMGDQPLADSVTQGAEPSLPVIASDSAPPAFKSLFLDLGGSDSGNDNTSIDELPFVSTHSRKSILKYSGRGASDRGIVLNVFKAQPTLEIPGTTNHARIVYAGFGLEAVNNDTGATTREELLKALFDWAWEIPQGTIENLSSENASALTRFDATFVSSLDGVAPVAWRWDPGDGSGVKGPFNVNMLVHSYEKCGEYKVRVEIDDSFGNRTVNSLDTTVTQCRAAEVVKPGSGSGAFGPNDGLFIVTLLALARRARRGRGWRS